MGFRVSAEEGEHIDALVRLSGLAKQDYILKRLLCQEVVVVGNPRVYKMLRNQFVAVLEELERLQVVDDQQEELLALIHYMASIMEGLKEGEE